MDQTSEDLGPESGVDNPGFQPDLELQSTLSGLLNDDSPPRNTYGSLQPSTDIDNSPKLRIRSSQADPQPHSKNPLRGSLNGGTKLSIQLSEGVIKLDSTGEQNLPEMQGDFLTGLIVGGRSWIYSLYSKNVRAAKFLTLFLLFSLYNAYLVTAVAYSVRNELDIGWCDGVGFLIIITGIVYWSFFYYLVKGMWGGRIVESLQPVNKLCHSVLSQRIARMGLGLLIFGGILAFIITDAWSSPRRLVSAGGYFIIILLITLMSTNPGYIQWRQVWAGLLLQFIFGMAVLRWEGGRSALECLSGKVTTFLAFSDVGSSFIYSFVASGEMEVIDSAVPELIGTVLTVPTIFAFKSLSVIFFFGFFVALLYHIGAMLWVVRKLGWLLQKIMGTSAAESMSAAANIFLGQTEAPLLIKPFINDLTKSELHAVMTGGFGTIAGTVMAAYISFGVKADSLLAASVMAAPCALALSKLMYPETEVSKTTTEKMKNVDTKSEGNALDAASQGAIQGIMLIGCIIANIIAFVSFVAFLNTVLSWFGGLVGVPQLTFDWLLGKIFIPVALIIGIDPDEAEDVALLLGLKTMVNEFLAYGRLQDLVKLGQISERSRRLCEFALCGFANISSVGIQLGGLGALAPDRRNDLSLVVWRALIAGTAASFMNACLAGALLDLDETLAEGLGGSALANNISLSMSANVFQL